MDRTTSLSDTETSGVILAGTTHTIVPLLGAADVTLSVKLPIRGAARLVELLEEAAHTPEAQDADEVAFTIQSTVPIPHGIPIVSADGQVRIEVPIQPTLVDTPTR